MANAPLANASWDSLRLRWAASPLPAALAAWWDGLLALLPESGRDVWFPPVRRLWLRPEGTRLLVEEQAGARRETLGDLPFEAESGASLRASLDRRGVDGEVWLVLPARDGLVRELVVPAAAEPQLDAVLRHEIDRQTPFPPDQVVFAGQVLSRDAKAGQLRVELAVLPRARLDAALAALGPLAERLAGVDLDDAAHRAGRRRNLLPAPSRRVRVDRDGRLRAALLGGAALALVLAGLVTLAHRERALADLEARRDAAFDAARQARALRAQLDGAATAANFLAETRAARPTALEVLDDLTRRLPDDVYLTRLMIEQDRVTMTGLAVSSGSVVAPLQGSPFLRSPALAGMVQKDPATGRDSFTVIAQLAPGGADAAR
ncbi:MAG: PilN domain-containing protein [Lysobacteraceae bacterium]